MLLPRLCVIGGCITQSQLAVDRKTTRNLTDRGLSLGHWQRGGGGGGDGEAVEWLSINHLANTCLHVTVQPLLVPKKSHIIAPWLSCFMFCKVSSVAHQCVCLFFVVQDQGWGRNAKFSDLIFSPLRNHKRDNYWRHQHMEVEIYQCQSTTSSCPWPWP